MKKTRNLIILVVILALAIVAYIVASVIAKREESKNETPEETVITIVDKEGSDVATVEYDMPKGGYSIEISSSTYYMRGDRKFPLDQAAAANIFENAASVSFIRLVSENGGSSDEYGLEAPIGTIYIKYSDNSEIKLNVGDPNEGAGGYYVNVDGENAVYLAESEFIDGFDYLYLDLLVDEKLTKPTDGFDAVTLIEVVFSDGSGYKYSRVPGSAENDEDIWSKLLADGSTAEGDFTETAEALYNEAFAIKPDIWVAYGVTESEQLSEYGLDDPYVKVTFTYEEEVTVSNSDGSTSEVTKVVEKTASLLFGYVSGDEEPESTETDAVTDDETGAETGDETDSDEAEATEETERYFILGDGKIVYLIPESDLPTLFPTEE